MLKNSLTLKILAIALTIGMSAQSFAETGRASEEEAKRFEKEYQESSDYTGLVLGAAAVVILGGAGFYFLGPVGAAGGAAVAAMKSPKKIGAKQMVELLAEATKFQNSPNK